MRAFVIVLASCALAQLPAASLAYADQVIAHEQRPTPISAHGGRVAWSSYQAATGEFDLLTQADGATSTVPIAARDEAFDIDLGENSEGQTVAAYSRCAKEFRGSEGDRR